MELTIPIVLWGKSPPEHPISSMYITSNGKSLITGCTNGQICAWDIETDAIIPKFIFMGHKTAVMCMLNLDDSSIISSSEDGVMATWDVTDGYCSNTMKLSHVHKHMQLVRKKDSRDLLLFCCGYYSDILVLNPLTLEILMTLNSLVESNWISCFHVQRSKQQADYVLGLTVNGTIKLWMLKHDDKDQMYYESESKKLNCENPVALKFAAMRSFILIICDHQWELYDTNFFTCISSNQSDEKLVGGNFFSSDQVIVWGENGKGFVYGISLSADGGVNANTELCFVLDPGWDRNAITCHKNLPGENKFYVTGDGEGHLLMWHLQPNTVPPPISSSLVNHWPASSFNCLQQWNVVSEPSISIFISGLNQIVLGFMDGTLIVVPALDLVYMNMFGVFKNVAVHMVLCGHQGRVNTLLYPHQIYEHYDRSYLVSGGCDFSVCLWNIFTGRLLHRFCVHSGEITQLIVPPSNCKSRIRKCVCSVASDHSVAILSLTEKKCVILASNHIFPIFSINWRPLDDFIIIECYDGSVYVWEMETGNLDRVLTGINAQEVLDACQELDIINDQYANPVVHFLRGVKSKNVSELFHAAQRGLSQIHHFILNEKQVETSRHSLPFLMDDLKFSQESIHGHVLYYNVDALISELYILSKDAVCSELTSLNKLLELRLLTQVTNFDVTKTVVSVLEKVKNEVENIQTKFDGKNETKNKKNLKLRMDSGDDARIEFVGNITRTLLSVLHCWDYNANLDDYCSLHNLLRPVAGTFGIVSSKGTLCLSIPKKGTPPCHLPSIRSSPALLSNYLCAFKSLINTMATVQSKNWNQLLDNGISSNDSNPKVLLLASMYQNECIEVRHVVHELLIHELRTLGAEKRMKLIKHWYSFLPTSKTLITSQERNLDSNVVVYNSSKFELQILALVIISTIRINFDCESQSEDDASIINHITRHLSSTLHFILHNLPKHLFYSKIRRITIDLLGKGFQVFQDATPNKTILCLLDLSSNIHTYLPAQNPSLSSVFDIAYTSHKALMNISRTDMQSFLNVLVEEINNHKIQSHSNLIIENSKTQIIFILNELMRTTDVSCYLIKFVDILLFCADATHLKVKNITEVFPDIGKHLQLHHCVEVHKIAVGYKNGSVAIYEVKHLRYSVVKAHKELVNCVKFSPDGKLLATFSYNENCLSLWAVSSTMFGFGNMQIKCLKSFDNACSRPENDYGELVWVSNKAVVLMFVNGSEKKFQL